MFVFDTCHGLGVVFIEQAADVRCHFTEKDRIGLEVEAGNVELAHAFQPPPGGRTL